jgi:hypothetical protein
MPYSIDHLNILKQLLIIINLDFRHGSRDKNVSIEMIRYMVARLPHADLRIYDEDHYTLAKHVEEILSDLLPVEA